MNKFQKPTTGETWLPQPKKIADQALFKQAEERAEYYEVGKRGTSTILMSVASEFPYWKSLYEKNADGKVAAILHPDGEAVYGESYDKDYLDLLKNHVTLDKTTHYDSLTMPYTLTIDGGNELQKPIYPLLGVFINPDDKESTSNYVTVKTIGHSLIQRVETTDATTRLTSISYSLRTPISTRQSLGFTPLEVNLKDYQFERGSFADDSISPITRGCGGVSSAVTRSEVITDADVQTAGKSPSGKQVYELKDINNPLMVKAYQEFIDFYKGSPSSTKYYNISQAEFAKQHAVIIYKDNSGKWLIYARDQLRPGGGCAKPVIYLYPEKAGSISVRVGADVKVSEPLYDAVTGWKQVWAQPNGRLTVGGHTYDSLFWEGPGVGTYPAITGGTVVARAEAAQTIRRQLAEQGLNAKETADFMAYWEPRLPNRPYVRLSWLTTTQMNKLAPLVISPRPATLLRVFLDFEGLDAPINLPAQRFSAPARDGFTVVEWGGLSQLKLY